jgi:hypothetical protein
MRLDKFEKGWLIAPVDAVYCEEVSPISTEICPQ